MSNIRQPAPTLNFKYDAERVKTLKMQGVDGSAFAVLRRPFLLDDALVPITPMVPDWLPEGFDIPKTNVRRQSEALHKLLIDPLRGRPIIGIGSMVTDDRAKFLAMSLMNEAIDMQKRGSHRGKLLPIWHRVSGGYYDELRDAKERKNISMLVIANVAPDDTAIKREKVRDLLEKYDHIPRIVVVNGSDPVSYFAAKIRMTMQYAFMLNNARSAKPDLLGML